MVEILLWLVPAAVVTLVTMLWVGWWGREGRGEVDLRLHVAPGDMGKVIGRRGRVAQALRQVVAAAGSREGVRASLDIVD